MAASALRFYEDRDLISSERAGSGHRRYERSVLRRIAFIVFAQRIGLTLGEIAEQLSKLPPNRAPGCGCLSLDRCQLANPGDRAGRSGPGPRYWVGDPRPA